MPTPYAIPTFYADEGNAIAAFNSCEKIVVVALSPRG